MKQIDNPITGINSPYNRAMAALMFGTPSGIFGEQPPGFILGGSGRMRLPQRVREKRRRLRQIAKASRKRNRH